MVEWLEDQTALPTQDNIAAVFAALIWITENYALL
jgi:hypothetical protein